MKNKPTIYVLFAAILFVIGTHAWADPQLVSSDTAGDALIMEETDANRLTAIGISDDGRYVLFTNYQTTISRALGPIAPLPPQDCRIYRKDTRTGKLLTVFEEEEGGMSFCNGARMSSDGTFVVTSPDGPLVQECEYSGEAGQFDCGEVPLLLVRNIDSGFTRIVWHRYIVNYVGSQDRYYGTTVFSVTPDASLAVIGAREIFANLTATAYSIVDIAARTVERFEPELEGALSPPGYPEIQLPLFPAISPDGSTIAAIVSAYLPPDSNDDNDECEPSSSWWPWDCQVQFNTELRLYLIDRATGAATYTALDNDASQIFEPRLTDRAWSKDGRYLSWLELPNFPTSCFDDPVTGEYVCFPENLCAAEECELTVVRFRVGDGDRSEYRTPYDPETLSLCRPENGYPNTNVPCSAQLNRDGTKLLYTRSVKHPFGDDWVPPALFSRERNYLCATPDSIETPGSTATFIDCPANDGPLLPSPGYSLDAVYSAPVNLYLMDVLSGESKLISSLNDGRMFQSSGAKLAESGEFVLISSRDPRLRDDLFNIAGLDEANLDKECFWSPDGHDGNLRVSTNDNVTYEYVAGDNSFYRMAFAPTYCAIPMPATSVQLFASDVSDEDSDSGSSSSFDLRLLALLMLLWLFGIAAKAAPTAAPTSRYASTLAGTRRPTTRH